MSPDQYEDEHARNAETRRRLILRGQAIRYLETHPRSAHRGLLPDYRSAQGADRARLRIA